LFSYIIHVSVFAFCYGRIFHTIRRQSKKVGGHAGRTQDVPKATTSRDPNAGQVQQQATGATTGQKLSRIEMNVLKTMIAIIACFMISWSFPTIVNLLQLIGVSYVPQCNFLILIILLLLYQYCMITIVCMIFTLVCLSVYFVLAVCLFVCLSDNKITAKVVDRFS